MFVRLASPVVAGLLAQGVTTRPPGLLTVRGRNTGRPHTTSVAVFKSGGRHWLAAIFGEVDWTRNLRATGEGMLTQGRSRTGVIAVERTPEAGGVVLRDAVARDAPSRLAAWFVRRYVEITPDAQQTEFVPWLGSIRCSSCANPHASSATAAATP